MAERPLECSDCKRPLSVRYTEIVGGVVTETVMCADCPVFLRKVHGAEPGQDRDETGEAIAGLCCGGCGTTLEEVQTGNPLGCSECYDVFRTILAEGLQRAGLLGPPKKLGRPSGFHIGRSPEESVQISSSLRLLALNEALDETLSQEDYEQAAWLRDQIKALTEESDAQ